MAGATQTDIRKGSILLPATDDLTGKEAYLGALDADGGIQLPDAITTIALFLIIAEAAATETVKVQPLVTNEEARIVAKGTGSAGDVLVLADPGTAADKGKVRTIPETGGAYFSPGIAQEDFVDGQQVRVRPFPRIVQVATQVTLTSTNGTAAAASASLANLAAEAEKIGDDVRAMHAALVSAGFLTA